MMNRNRVRGTWIVAIGLMLAGAACGEEGGEMAITGVAPQAGALQGEQPVKITGKNFRTDIGYTVYFGGEKATSVTIIDPETLVVTTPQRDDPGEVDITVRADHGPAFRIASAFKYEDMGGSVVEGMGQGATSQEKGNLAY